MKPSDTVAARGSVKVRVTVGAAGAQPDRLLLAVTGALFALTGIVGWIARRRARTSG